ncbi:MAG: hypothetical protein LBC18_03320 [Opitutaceae bacterium]|jgi:hypothetical protein|nr:hypothetical protein [Opitutaceae bacterium]
MSPLDKAAAAAAEPAIAGITHVDASSNQQAVPVPWGVGKNPFALTWVIPEAANVWTKDIKQKVGKKNTTVGYDYYCDVAGIACVGPAHTIHWIEVDGEMAWQGARTRSPGAHEETFVTGVGTFYVTWGAWDQPADTRLLNSLSGQTHPAYRGQVRVVVKSLYCGSHGATVPTVRICVARAPDPSPLGLALDPPRLAGAAQQGGESAIGAILELAGHPAFGAGLPASLFGQNDWQAAHAAVAQESQLGGLSPTLDRAQPLRDALKDLAAYYEGFFRLENGRLRPGFFPRAAAAPAGLPVLGLHDYTLRPQIKATALAAQTNAVALKYRNGADAFKETLALAEAPDAIAAAASREPADVSMPHVILAAQAAKLAARAAADGAAGEITAEGAEVRPARAVNAGGSALQAGDQCRTRLIALEDELLVRVTRRTDNRDGTVSLDFAAEKGAAPSPATADPDPAPATGRYTPLPVASARVWELPSGLAPTAGGIHIAILAQRPAAQSESGLTRQNVVGFSIWHSGAGASYDTLGSQNFWAVKCTLDAALSEGTAPVNVSLTPDPDAIDIDRVEPQTPDNQVNNTLLLLAGGEVFSIGALAFDENGGLDAATAMRARLGTAGAAHAAGEECWLVWRDEIRAFTHAAFISAGSRLFKLQPYNSGFLELDDAPVIQYHFRDRGPEAPQCTVTTPASPVAGSPLVFEGAVFDINGDLASYEFRAEQLDPGAGNTVIGTLTLAAGVPLPVERAQLALKCANAFPRAGVWRLALKAADEAGAAGHAATLPFTVAARVDGGWGEPVPEPPAAPENLSGAGGVETIVWSWAQAGAGAVAGWQLCVRDMPGLEDPEVTHDGLAAATRATPAGAGQTLYCRARAIGKNGLASPWTAEAAATALSLSTDALASAGASIAELQTKLPGLARDIKALLLAQGDTHAAVQVLAEAFVQPDGTLAVRHAVTLDNNGWITGTEQFNGGPGSDYFDVLASSFRVRAPGAAGVVAFEVANGEIRAKKAVIPLITSDMISVGSLSAITATIGLLKSAEAPNARLEITTDQINVYDQNNTLRVRLGRLAD